MASVVKLAQDVRVGDIFRAAGRKCVVIDIWPWAEIDSYYTVLFAVGGELGEISESGSFIVYHDNPFTIETPE